MFAIAQAVAFSPELPIPTRALTEVADAKLRRQLNLLIIATVTALVDERRTEAARRCCVVAARLSELPHPVRRLAPLWLLIVRPASSTLDGSAVDLRRAGSC